MKRSTHHILTTHTGSLPRPTDLVDMVLRKEEKQPVNEDVLAMRVRSAVAEVVRRQAEVGLTVLNDGEHGKPGYSTYMKDRLTGFEGESTAAAVSGEAKDFPEYTARRTGRAVPKRPACTGPIAWKNRDAVRKDIENLQAAIKEVKAEEVFMTAASPGVVPHFMKDQYYGSEEKYLYALADALKEEYDAIHRAGFVLQVDCPDLCMSRHNRFSDLSTNEFKKIAELHVAALNHALRDIPADRVRLHMCWGNYEGPHHLDIPLREIIDVALKAKASALSFEGANPRHEHEWVVFKEVRLPDGVVIIPGVIDSTTNFVEHPELVAQRIVRYADVVGRENVIAGTDCGFGTFVRAEPAIDSRIVWAKLQSLAEGAAIASKQLWN
jgi:5-methyltetrahydropteroyltriglutamate--homocysteine methyltransferase